MTVNLPKETTGGTTPTGGMSMSDIISMLGGGYKTDEPTQQAPQQSSMIRGTYRVSPTAQITSRMWIPAGERPEMPEIPQFELPEYDEEEITRLTQKRAAPGIRQLGQAVRTAMSRPYKSPQIQRMSLKQALEEYSMGMESIMGGAGTQAVGEYGQRLGRETQAAQMQWQADVQRLSQIYDTTMQEYARGGTTEARQFYEYEDEGEFSWDELFEERGLTRG